MRKVIMAGAFAIGFTLTFTACSNDDYEEYEYEGNEKIEVEDDDREERNVIIVEDEDDYEDEEWDD